MAVITIIGIGQYGTALACVAAEKGNEIRMAGSPVDDEIVDACRKMGAHPKLNVTYPEGIEFYYCKDWQKAVKGADFVVGAVSSFGVDWFLDDILMNLDPAIPVLSAAKGLMEKRDGSLISYPSYWEAQLAKAGIKRDIYALGGPGKANALPWRRFTYENL